MAVYIVILFLIPLHVSWYRIFTLLSGVNIISSNIIPLPRDNNNIISNIHSSPRVKILYHQILIHSLCYFSYYFYNWSICVPIYSKQVMYTDCRKINGSFYTYNNQYTALPPPHPNSHHLQYTFKFYLYDWHETRKLHISHACII